MNWLDVTAETQRREQDLAWAERERFVRAVAQQNRPAVRLYQRWLVRLGGQLVEWGGRLQTRYERALLAGGRYTVEGKARSSAN
jgi:hypothetical protein